MSEVTAGRPSVIQPRRAGVVRQLSVVDRFLPAWILLAMVAGLLIGRVWPGLGTAIAHWQIQDVSVPIAVGLFLMMYPILSRVRYERVANAARDWRMLGASLLLNWIVGPAFMFALAWLLLPDQPALRTGVILVGLARCIAMVLVWNQLAAGDPEYAAILVAVNAVFQIVTYAGLAVFYPNVLPGSAHWQIQDVSVPIAVGLFLMMYPILSRVR